MTILSSAVGRSKYDKDVLLYDNGKPGWGIAPCFLWWFIGKSLHG